MLHDVVGLLADPATGDPLHWVDEGFGILSSASGRRYDVARQGYVSLFADGRSFPGDTPAMLQHRHLVQEAGLYHPLADTLQELVSQLSSPYNSPPAPESAVVVDMGAGTGYYTRRIASVWDDPQVVAVDISAAAGKRLARLPGRTGAVVADVWKPWPLRSGVATVITHIFSPCNAPEAARVLAPGGHVIVVTPTGRHLRELVTVGLAVSVEEDKLARLDATMGEFFTTSKRVVQSWSLESTPRHIASIVAMGPSAYHGEAEQRHSIITEHAAELQTISCEVVVTVFEKKSAMN